MGHEQDILREAFKYDLLHNEDQKTVGIARRALDQGYDSLSPLQRGVIAHLFSAVCEGVVNPGGHRNNCRAEIDGAELVEAISQSNYYGAVLCESCRNEKDGYRREWDRIQAE